MTKSVVIGAVLSAAVATIFGVWGMISFGIAQTDEKNVLRIENFSVRSSNQLESLAQQMSSLQADQRELALVVKELKQEATPNQLKEKQQTNSTTENSASESEGR